MSVVDACPCRPRPSDQERRSLLTAMSAFFRSITGPGGNRSASRTQGHRPGGPSAEGCIFCLRDDPELNQIACESPGFFARYDNFPATDGHLEIVPKRHVESFFELSKEEIAEAYSLLVEARGMLDRKYSPHGYTIGVNEGTAAGRSVDHLHIHLIPRYEGDVEDPRGGIRRAAPNCDPDTWTSDATRSPVK